MLGGPVKKPETRKTGFSLALERVKKRLENSRQKEQQKIDQAQAEKRERAKPTDIETSDQYWFTTQSSQQNGSIKPELQDYEPVAIRGSIDVGKIPSSQLFYTSAIYTSTIRTSYGSSYETRGDYRKDLEIRYLQEKLAELEAQLEYNKKQKEIEQVRLNPNLFTDEKIGPSRAISFEDEDQKDGYRYNGEINNGD